MVYISYTELWRSVFCNNVSAKDRVQGNNLNQIKLKVNDTNKRNEKITTNFEPSDKKDVISKTYLDTNLSKIKASLSIKEKDFNEFKLRNDEQSEDVLIERAVITTLQNFMIRDNLKFMIRQMKF